MENRTESVLRVFLERSREIIALGTLEDKLRHTAEAIVEAELFHRVAVQLYADRYGEKLFGLAGVSPEEQAWLKQHDTLTHKEYNRAVQSSQNLGDNIFFVAHDLLEQSIGDLDSFLLPSQVAWPGPGYWHPDDMLLAPLVSSKGEHMGNLSADDPPDGALPTSHTARLIAPFLAIASLVVEQSLTLRQDSLTGLFNGPFFNEDLQRSQADGSLSGLVFLDMDDLKWVNDHQGHAAGDQRIRQTAQAIDQFVQDVLGSDGRAFRLHGDEFVVIVRGRHLSNIIETLTEQRDQKMVAISYGVALYDPSKSLDHLVFTAEQAMYEDKQRRKRRGSP